MSITGQVGHVALAKQTGPGVPNVTGSEYRAVKITGDSLVANNNMLVAEGEIGTGRDVSQAIPGGFSSAGAINGNLRAKAALIFAYGALGARTIGTAAPLHDVFTPADTLPSFTIEKKVGTTGSQLLVLQYSDAMINTLNISVTSGGLSTFSAGIIAAGETKIAAPLVTPSYGAASDDLLVFHGGRILAGDFGTALAVGVDYKATPGSYDSTFQSVEVVVNNNVAADEYTVRPSRFLRSLTEGIRSVELNITQVFENNAAYERYTYGKTGRVTPGYQLYTGAFQMLLTNWQALEAEDITTPTVDIGGTGLSGAGTNPQAVQFDLPKLAFSGLPVALSTGRIAVSTTARALKDPANVVAIAQVRPGGVVEGLT